MKIGKRKWDLNWHSSKLDLRHIFEYKGRNEGKDRGYGVFAKSAIKKGEDVAIFGGYIIPIGEVKKLSKQLQEYCYQIHDNFFYGPVMHSEISLNEHYNHNCEPNVGFKDSVTLIALRDIKENEELTMDYAMLMTTDMFNFKCSCDSKKCRKFITGNDWKIKDLQKKYGAHFQPYILEKIKKSNK
jgi:uncharacterized protein